MLSCLSLLIIAIAHHCGNNIVDASRRPVIVSSLHVIRNVETAVWLANKGSNSYNNCFWEDLSGSATLAKAATQCEQLPRKSSSLYFQPPVTLSCEQHTSNANRRQKSTLVLSSFQKFRIKYLLVFVAVMLADGLQGTHLYALYDGYGLNVQNLYAAGFAAGALTAPFLGALVDKFGRRNSALVYCFLEMIINALEQYNFLPGIIVSRLIGGITTNLLFTVFESWLITEHRNRGFPNSKLEILLRDTVVSSNLSAIGSGFLAHILASIFGRTGPFKGTVVVTGIALLLIATQWGENYGRVKEEETVWGILSEATRVILSDSKIFRLGFIQALTEGALQTFVFLWAPFLMQQSSFSSKMTSVVLGLDNEGFPAYGLIFGSFMFFGALGSLTEPVARKLVARLTSPSSNSSVVTFQRSPDQFQLMDDDPTTPFTVEMLSALCFLLCAALLLVPQILSFVESSQKTFITSLVAFFAYEYIVGIYLPCEGIMRSIYMPTHSICSLMTILRVIVNLTVAVGVVLTNYISLTTAFTLCAIALFIACFLQLTLVTTQEWEHLWQTYSKPLRALSLDSECFETKNTDS